VVAISDAIYEIHKVDFTKGQKMSDGKTSEILNEIKGIAIYMVLPLSVPLVMMGYYATSHDLGHGFFHQFNNASEPNMPTICQPSRPSISPIKSNHSVLTPD
jgi:hypothetical protein